MHQLVALYAIVVCVPGSVTRKTILISFPALLTRFSESDSKVQSTQRQEGPSLLEEVIKIRKSMERLEHTRSASQNDTGIVIKAALEPVQDQLNVVAVASERKLDSISMDVMSIATSVSHFGGILSNIVRFLRAIRSETRAALQQILQTNMQIYAMLVASQNNINATPSLLLESNIQFEDALGRKSSLPYQWFRHWEVRAIIHEISLISLCLIL